MDVDLPVLRECALLADGRHRQLRGNLPQAFVHAVMREASVRLAGPWPGVDR